MPHLDALTLRNAWTSRRAYSPFARPVAAVTAIVIRWADALRAPTKPRLRQDIEVRSLEERLGHASDLHDLERMERAYARRDAGGTGGWDWR